MIWSSHSQSGIRRVFAEVTHCYLWCTFFFNCFFSMFRTFASRCNGIRICMFYNRGKWKGQQLTIGHLGSMKASALPLRYNNWTTTSHHNVCTVLVHGDWNASVTLSAAMCSIQICAYWSDTAPMLLQYWFGSENTPVTELLAMNCIGSENF